MHSNILAIFVGLVIETRRCFKVNYEWGFAESDINREMPGSVQSMPIRIFIVYCH